MKKWFVFLAVITFLSGACFAQDKPMSKKEQQAKQKQTKKQLAPMALVKQEPKQPPVVMFSMGMLESGRIDPGYMGIPAAEAIDAIEKITGAMKGEFELTADYNARVSELSRKFLGDFGDVLAFTVPASKGRKYINGLQYEFNADTGDVNLYVFPSAELYNRKWNGIGAPDYATNPIESRWIYQFKLSTKIDLKSTYQGKNAYGTTVLVEKTIMSELGIAAKNLFNSKDYVFKSQFRLENSRAAQELPALKVLIVMKLAAPPFVAYNYSHVEPRHDNPVDISVNEKYLTGNVIGIVFYSGLTGEIFARFPETFGKPVPEDKPVNQ
ncbi:MAG: hypothetical protein Q7U37_03020 [Gallionella sp.]|nr:hypothetical protein [Gallionella sp.]